DTIPLKNPSKKIHVLSTAELFAEVIKKVENYESLSEFFNAK
ncbi:MAG: ribose-phosphate pyrophosphokinase, partial [Bacteroidetes bacterium]|nr:ribose-phosphate pyrophosphokinase [Bacteroidota bacterium]